MTPFRFSQRLSVGAWCLYDWANSAFATVIVTFVYSVYFARGIVGDETQGSVLWGYAIGISGALVAVAGPVSGAAADRYGAVKRWLGACVGLCILATAGLWFGVPGSAPGGIALVLGLVVLANVGFELSLVFYNALLPHVVSPGMMGRVSGWAWGLGYAGGLVCLVIVLFGLVGLGETAPWLALPRGGSEHIRAAAVLTALWFLVFSLPVFIFVKDTKRTGLKMGATVRSGISGLAQTVRAVRSHANLALFLAASALYRDGLATLFAVGGLYAAGTFGMGFQDILLFAIGLNVTAGLGAFILSFADDRMGSRPVILLSLAALTTLGAGLVLVESRTAFIVLSLALGLFVGPTQAASRTLAARLAPPDMVGQTYGLYALTGKSIAFLGPLAFSAVTAASGSQRAGVATILLFWLAGTALLAKVREQ